MNQRLSIRWYIGLLALVAAGCAKNITEPEITRRVAIAGPTLGVLEGSYYYTATVSFTSSAMLYYRWRFDDSTFETAPTVFAPKQHWTFHTLGTHLVHVDAIRTGDNA